MLTPRQALGVLVAAFRVDRLEEETIRLYEAKLRDIHGELLEKAIHRITERAKFFPSIAEIRQTAAELAGMLPMAAEQAAAVVRQADVERPVYRRDGTYAYTEHEWQWPEDLSWHDLGVIRAALAKCGESYSENGKRVFGWEQGFKAAYEREAVGAVATMDLSTAKALPTGPQPKALPVEPEAPRPKFASKMLEIIQGVVEKRITEEDAHQEIARLFDEGQK